LGSKVKFLYLCGKNKSGVFMANDEEDVDEEGDEESEDFDDEDFDDDE
jgi:hypothetical protein